jgi:hypothetical protein
MCAEGMRSLYLATLSGTHIAMRHLEATGAQALPVLCRALKNRDPVVRMRAAWVLGRIGTEAGDALPALRKAADDPAWYVADEARRALARVAPGDPPRELSTPVAIDNPQPVKVEDRDTAWRLDNGLLSCEVDKNTGSLVMLRQEGDSRNLFGAKGAWYATFPWTLPRGMAPPKWIEKQARIVRQSDDLVEVAVTLRLDAPRPIVEEQHFVLRRGVSGVYQFAVFRKPREGQAVSGIIFDYARFMKADANIFRHAAVSDSLQGELYTPEQAGTKQCDRSPVRRPVVGQVFLVCV